MLGEGYFELLALALGGRLDSYFVYIIYIMFILIFVLVFFSGCDIGNSKQDVVPFKTVDFSFNDDFLLMDSILAYSDRTFENKTWQVGITSSGYRYINGLDEETRIHEYPQWRRTNSSFLIEANLHCPLTSLDLSEEYYEVFLATLFSDSYLSYNSYPWYWNFKNESPPSGFFSVIKINYHTGIKSRIVEKGEGVYRLAPISPFSRKIHVSRIQMHFSADSDNNDGTVMDPVYISPPETLNDYYDSRGFQNTFEDKYSEVEFSFSPEGGSDVILKVPFSTSPHYIHILNIQSLPSVEILQISNLNKVLELNNSTDDFETFSHPEDASLRYRKFPDYTHPMIKGSYVFKDITTNISLTKDDLFSLDSLNLSREGINTLFISVGFKLE